MATALDIIESSLRKLGVLISGGSASANQQTDHLETLNTLLPSLQTQRLYVYQNAQRSLSWPAATSTATIGASGYFSTVARPDRITAAYCTISGIDYPIRVLDNRDQYDAIPQKTASASIPEALFYDPAFPNGVIHLYGVPSSALTLLVNTYETLQSFANVTTVVSLPPGYQRMLEWTLSEELLPEYPNLNKNSVQIIMNQARKARSAIKSLNTPVETMATEVGYLTSRQYGNIIEGP